MKILYIITRSDIVGGASVHVLDLAAGMQALGHEVLILVGGNGMFLEYALKRKLRVHSLCHLLRRISPLEDVRAVKEIGKVIREFSPDLLHLHSSKAGVIGRLAARLNNIPSIFTAHGWAFTEGVSPIKRQFYRAIEYLLAPLTARIITVSDYDRGIALRYGVGDADLLTTIPNGVHDTASIAPKSCGDEVVKLIMVARFEEPKDHSLLLRALAPLKHYPWTIEFVGEGPMLQGVQILVAKLGLADKVFFSGFCEDVADRIQMSDVLVLASKWEGLPLTIIEAMRGRVAVIASNVGGVSELVVDGVTGYLALAGSEISMSECLEATLRDIRRRESMGDAGRARYEDFFSFEMMRDRTYRLYETVVYEARK